MRHSALRWIAGTCVIATVAACHKQEAETKPVVPVQVSPVVRGSIRNVITADAVLYPRDEANIIPKVSAPLRRYFVQRGAHVKANQLVAELENRDLTAAATSSRGQLTQAQANLRSTQAATLPEEVTKAQADVDSGRQALDAAQKLFDSRQELFRQGAIAKKQVDEAQVGLAQAKAQFDTAQQHLASLQGVGRETQVQSAQGQVESAQGQYEAAQAQVAFSQIRSPIAGVVTDRPLWIGEVAAPDKPVLTVMDIAIVVARINMAQEQARDVHVGDMATIGDDSGAEPLPGTVTVVSPATDPSSTTVQVWVQAANAGERLRPGQTVHVSIVAATIDNALLVPSAAILASDEGGSKVMVVDGQGVAHETKVEVGVREGDHTQVRSGVTAGQQVVINGGVGLEDKAKVRVLKPGQDAADSGDDEEKK